MKRLHLSMVWHFYGYIVHPTNHSNPSPHTRTSHPLFLMRQTGVTLGWCWNWNQPLHHLQALNTYASLFIDYAAFSAKIDKVDFQEGSNTVAFCLNAILRMSYWISPPPFVYQVELINFWCSWWREFILRVKNENADTTEYESKGFLN